MGLRLKLALYVVLFVGTVLGLVGYLRAKAERDLHVNEMEARGITLLRSFAIPCGVSMANNDMPTLDNYISQFARESKTMDLRYMAVLDFQGRVAAHTRSGEFGKVYTDPFTTAAIQSEDTLTRIINDNGEPVLEISVPMVSGLRWGTLRAGFNLVAMERTLARREVRLVLTGIAVSLGAVAIAYLALSFLVIRPVLSMSQMARRFGEGMLETRVKEGGSDEMGELGRQLNNMATQIQNYTGSLEKLVDERTAELAKTNEQLQTANRQLDRLARTDSLTGLYNRRHFMEEMEFELRRAQRTPHQFALIMLDVDYFKHYNDTNGHTAGDDLLVRLANLLEVNTRSTDLVARYGGEEFIIMLLDTAPEDGIATANKLRAVVANQSFPNEERQPDGRLTVSVGVSFFPQDAHDANTLIDLADQALYRSKARGRDQVSTATQVASQS